MPTDTRIQPSLEPVHVRRDQPTAPTVLVPTRPAIASPPAPGEPTKPLLTSRPHAIPPKPQPTQAKQSPKQSSSGVTLAIIATVIIVLGLAGLAVLAYIKTQK